MIKEISGLLAVSLLCVTCACAAPADRLVHKNLDCAVCHSQTGKGFVSPESKTCIGCHGGMNDIKLKPNAYKKDAHHSPHYADLLECTQCHAEHKASHAICNDCHKVKWSKLK